MSNKNEVKNEVKEKEPTEKVEDEQTLEQTKETEIKVLQEQIRSVRQKGRFSMFYNDVRKGTVKINKLTVSEDEKKIQLRTLLQKNLDELNKIL